MIDETELQQTVHLFGLKKCIVRIGGKVNAISLGMLHPLLTRLLTIQSTAKRRPSSWTLLSHK